MKTNLKNKYKGMLWGLVVGDCLGSPIQFTGKDEHPYKSNGTGCSWCNFIQNTPI